jgi:hypothetical protein
LIPTDFGIEPIRPGIDPEGAEPDPEEKVRGTGWIREASVRVRSREGQDRIRSGIGSASIRTGPIGFGIERIRPGIKSEGAEPEPEEKV